MKRVLGKVLDGLARIFFGLTRWVAAVTGRSLSVSVIGAMVILGLPHVFAWRLLGWSVLVYDALVLVTLVGVTAVVKSYDIAFRDRDFAEVTRIRAIIEGKGEPRGPAMRALKRVGDGELLLQFEKWDEAADVFATIELADLPEVARPGILSELGYARAHSGRVDKGVADIERALADAAAQSKYPAGKRFHLLRRHGIALSLAGEHERAVDVIAALRDDFQGDKREWAEAFYFLGLSHAALDDTNAAAGALACAVAGDGPFVSRSWKVLEEHADPAELAELRREVANREKPN